MIINVAIRWTNKVQHIPSLATMSLESRTDEIKGLFFGFLLNKTMKIFSFGSKNARTGRFDPGVMGESDGSQVSPG